MKKMINSSEKTVLVTGASRGIGKSIAELLIQEGYKVFISAKNQKRLQDTAKEINAAGFFALDLSCANAESLEQLFSVTGNIDILVNNAGDYVYSPIEKTSDEDIHRLLSLNVEAPFMLIRSVVTHMKNQKWGRIVNIGSISGVVGEANASLYSLTKSAFLGLTKSLALELAQDNITINTINPGWVDTELAKDAVEESTFSYEEELDMIPQRRFIRPEEIANLVKYMISQEAKGMTGQSVNLCAGLSVG
ncbi:MAG: SDR family oxidoreductase [Clostridium sp.]|nr:SDR family oxidoreductase [Clostridium sp.]